MTATTAAFVAELERVAGVDAVRSRTETLEACAVAGVTPAAVVEPADAAGVAAVLALCSDAGVPVEAAGGCTWLGAGAAPPAPPVVVSTRRLSSIAEYEPADLVAGVQAGMTHDELARQLAAHGQMLPLDPPARPGASVGATVALGSAGPLRAAYGTPRDMVLGVEIATGDGRLLRFGGRVVKNVAGYDIVRLVTGSRGRLGIITSVYALLRSAPEVDRTFLVRAGATAAAAADAALAVRDRLECAALELLAPGLADDLNGAGAGAGWILAVRIRGNAAGVADAADRLTALLPAARMLPGADAATFWSGLAASEAGAAVSLRVADLPASLGRTLATGLALASNAAAPAAGNGAHGDGAAGAWRIAAHAANGIVRLWRPPGAAPLDAAAMAPALTDHGAAHVAAGGSLHWPVLPAALAGLAALAERQTDARPDDVPDDAHSTRALMRAIARTFDPAGIMAPGRRGF